VFYAPAGTALEDMFKGIQALGASASMTAEAVAKFVDLVGSPKQELLWRLNEQVNQRDPGKPNHWRGLE
jgi:hypothetical protein